MKIFISYARKDNEKEAISLYNALQDAGFEPWIDVKEIKAGQNWKNEIYNAIQQSDIFIALLSDCSISKKGYVQKELKIALDVLDEHPLNKIYLIPIRLTDCEPLHDKLREIQWLDFFPSFDNGIKKLINHLTKLYEKRASTSISRIFLTKRHKVITLAYATFIFLIFSSVIGVLSEINIIPLSIFKFDFLADNTPYHIFLDYKHESILWSSSIVILSGEDIGVGELQGNEKRIKLVKESSRNLRDSLYLNWKHIDDPLGKNFVSYIIWGIKGQPFNRDEMVWENNTIDITKYSYLTISIKNLEEGFIHKNQPILILRLEDIFLNSSSGNEKDQFIRIGNRGPYFNKYTINLKKLDYSKSARDWVQGRRNFNHVNKKRIKQLTLDCFNSGNILIDEIFFH